MRKTHLALAIAVALAACSSDKSQGAQSAAASSLASAPRHATSGLPVIPLRVTTAKGKHAFKVEVAATSQEQAQGLMFRTEMGADEGMIFPMDPPRMASFWMKNTVIPLDIIYIGTDRRILNIFARTEPYSEKPLFSKGAVSAVLELNGGRAAELGIVPGDKVEW
ncbi:DUF192 domain-containing protein [Novosphingobium sp. TH158]|uniref:DUF192 domain-containing protein n=1 Tax=Novosphingobium sp. TH158 TaxID=2067455 RepID=UPI00156FB3C0